MSALRVPLSDLRAGLRDLDEQSARYVGRVHRLRQGDRFIAFDPERGVQAQARVVTSQRGRVVCELSEPTAASQVVSAPAWLLLGVCKGDRFEWALREAVALAVTDIVPTLFARSASPGTKTDDRRLERWRRILVQGARQCGRGDVPRLHAPLQLAEALGCVPPELSRVCLWEQAREPAGPVFLQKAPSSGIALVVGPEGGIEPSEAAQAERAGYRVVTLGSSILRTETAVIAALGAWAVCRSAQHS